MSPATASLILALAATISPDAAPAGPRATYQSAKSVPALQKCLTDKLSHVGEVVAVDTGGETRTLVLRKVSTADPMMIDLAPQSVTVTTRFVQGTRHLVEACL